MNRKKQNVLILHNIRSVQNVGAMFRTADAAGIDKIYLVGYTATPLDRFGNPRKDLMKSALGAEDFVDWEHKENLSFLKELKEEGFQIIGIEQSNNSIDYRKIKMKSKNAFIVGNEVSGIPYHVLKKCTVIAELPMMGKKKSLNVSVALGAVILLKVPS